MGGGAGGAGADGAGRHRDGVRRLRVKTIVSGQHLRCRLGCSGTKPQVMLPAPAPERTPGLPSPEAVALRWQSSSSAPFGERLQRCTGGRSPAGDSAPWV
eukprot:2655302-Prymnesium_polylepis.1